LEREEQLAWERRNARWAAACALASALLTLAGTLVLLKTLDPSPKNNVDGIALVHDKPGPLLIAAILQALGTAFTAPTLYYLFHATRFRRPQLPRVLRYLVLIAPVAAAVLAVVHQIQLQGVADRVFPHLPDVIPKDAAHLKPLKQLVNDEIGKGPLVAVSGVATAAGLGLAFSFLMVSLNAMRAGLLSRFMGILGVIVGVLLVLPILPLPILQIFWLGAIALLFLGPWPQGRGPAWETGEAIDWPSAQQRRDALMGGDGAPARGRGRGRTEPEPDDGEGDGDGYEEPATPQHTGEPARPRQSATHPRSKKRKRKRR
jgi:hypothetical protein